MKDAKNVFWATLKFNGREPPRKEFMYAWRSLTKRRSYKLKKLREKGIYEYFQIRHYLDCLEGGICDHNLILKTSMFHTDEGCETWFRPMVDRAFGEWNYNFWLRSPLDREAVAHYVTGDYWKKNKRALPPVDWINEHLVFGR
jgi:hypothetical protein